MMSDFDKNNSAALIGRLLDSPIAVVLDRHSPLGLGTQVTARQFLSHVHSVAKLLPDKSFAINLCENRYFFMVSFCAVIVKAQTNLLPPNKKPATQEWLAKKYSDTYILHDGYVNETGFGAFVEGEKDRESALAEHLLINALDADFGIDNEVSRIPRILLNHLAAISFTSGSTGQSKPNEKSWQTIVESSQINALNMLGEHHSLCYQLATVPPQHMWGLETSVLLPLFVEVCVADSKPLFPQDIYDALGALPAPKMLVSSPIHLRSLVKSNIAGCFSNSPSVDLVLCATSPLNRGLATDVELLFSAKLREVYGCSEIGSMAVRETARNDFWHLFSGVYFKRSQGNKVFARTRYLPNEIEISDEIIMESDSCFVLKGRSSDMIDIAGKRGSLQEINNTLVKFTELIDGVVFIPETGSNVDRLAALVVLPDDVDINELKEYLKTYLDDAFVPRAIIKVDSLPRNDSGKLPMSKLNELYRSLIKSK